METHEQLQKELRKIDKWEKGQKGLFFWEKLGRLPFALLDKVTPAFIHKQVDKLLTELASYIDYGGQYLVNNDATVKTAATQLGKMISIEKVPQLALAEMDLLAEYFIKRRAKNAQIQGASTGVGGIFTLAIDIPFILGLTLKTMQEVAISYGFDPNDKAERIFMIKCMQFASADIVGKKAILEDLSQANKTQSFAQLQGWKEVFMTYRDNFGWKKLFQMVPIAGIIFGAYINKSTIEDVGEVAQMLYKKRRIIERLECKRQSPA